MNLPRAGGTYVLLMPCRDNFELAYGRSRAAIAPGWYLYVGSAFGPGGLAARLGHHLRAAPRPHWHIDHLRRRLPVHGLWYCTAGQRLEHLWAHRLGSASAARIDGFGASDCACSAHLFRFSHRPAPRVLHAPGETTEHRVRAIELDPGPTTVNP